MAPVKPAYIDVIEVHRDRGVAYMAWYCCDYMTPGHWASHNNEISLDLIEKAIGKTLPNGRQEPWVRLEDPR